MSDLQGFEAMTDVNWKQVGLTAASISLLLLVFYGKYKLAFAKPTLLLIFAGGLLFALTEPAQGSVNE